MIVGIGKCSSGCRRGQLRSRHGEGSLNGAGHGEECRMKGRLLVVAAVTSAYIPLVVSPSAVGDPGDCAHLGTVGPNGDGSSYTVCTKNGWTTVNRPVCKDYPKLFDCLGNPIDVPGPKSNIAGDGTFRVGTDIALGPTRRPVPSSPAPYVIGSGTPRSAVAARM
jgi:hypothetical protein